MSDVVVGKRFRALRQRRGWRQEDLAVRAGVSQDVISRIERGRLEGVPLAKLRRVAAALDGDLLLLLRWRGGDLDRLVDEAHAHLVGRLVELLTTSAWQVRSEVSYSVYGERGAIDVLAWHPTTRTLLVVEVKSELASVEETLRKHDEKVRLAGTIASERFAWRPAKLGRLLVLPDLSTPRRRVERHAILMNAAYPVRGPDLRRWLSTPSDSIAGILFLNVGDRAARPAGTWSRKRFRVQAA